VGVGRAVIFTGELEISSGWCLAWASPLTLLKDSRPTVATSVAIDLMQDQVLTDLAAVATGDPKGHR
jgi:hypothetical protein